MAAYVPKGFVEDDIYGKRMHVWRPSEQDEKPLTEPLGSSAPLWQRLILELCDPGQEFSVREVSVCDAKEDELFSIQFGDPGQNLDVQIHSAFFGDGETYINFRERDKGVDVTLPWEDDNDLELEYKCDGDGNRKTNLIMSQMLTYLNNWFGDVISGDVTVTFNDEGDMPESITLTGINVTGTPLANDDAEPIYAFSMPEKHGDPDLEIVDAFAPKKEETTSLAFQNLKDIQLKDIQIPTSATFPNLKNIRYGGDSDEPAAKRQNCKTPELENDKTPEVDVTN